MDHLTSKSDAMRTRAVYMMGLAFIATQFINLLNMSYSYGAFTFDHLISVSTCALVLLTILSLRHTKRFTVYAVVYSALIIAATMSSALNQNAGINSSLLPFLILGVVLNGFICGWRATCVFGGLVLICIWTLWSVSSGYDHAPIFDPENYKERNFQRAVQASLATLFITMMAAFFSKNMDSAFKELETALTAAQTSDRAKTNFLATMSHELCTPMNGIIGMNNILEETELDEEQKELTGIIRESGKGLQTIIGNVLLYSQLEAERVSLDDGDFTLNALLNKTIATYAKHAAEKGLELKTHIGKNVPSRFIGDETRLIQLIQALLDNALKFTDKGSIELSVTGAPDEHGKTMLLLSVTDTGIGIPKQDQARIFDRFTQKDGSIKRRHGGTGLGLTVARGLAELMGGTLTVRSEPGIGSSFSASLVLQASNIPQEHYLEAAE